MPAIGLRQHADENRPEHFVLLSVDQEFGEGATLREWARQGMIEDLSRAEALTS